MESAVQVSGLDGRQGQADRGGRGGVEYRWVGADDKAEEEYEGSRMDPRRFQAIVFV
jgi:hypothetical protein